MLRAVMHSPLACRAEWMALCSRPKGHRSPNLSCTHSSLVYDEMGLHAFDYKESADVVRLYIRKR